MKQAKLVPKLKPGTAPSNIFKLQTALSSVMQSPFAIRELPADLNTCFDDQEEYNIFAAAANEMIKCGLLFPSTLTLLLSYSKSHWLYFKIIDEVGTQLLVENSRGEMILNPRITIAQKHHDNAIKWAKELGLGLLSRKQRPIGDPLDVKHPVSGMFEKTL